MSIATSTRSKGCSDKMKAGVCPAGPCEECERLHIECLGYEPRHPPWLKVTNFHMVIICSADVDTIEKERRSHPRYQRIYEGIERGRRQVLFSRTRISQKKFAPHTASYFRLPSIRQLLQGHGLEAAFWDKGFYASLR